MIVLLFHLSNAGRFETRASIITVLDIYKRADYKVFSPEDFLMNLN